MPKSSFTDHELKPLARSIAATHFARAILKAKPARKYYRILTLPMYWDWEEMLLNLIPADYETNVKFIGVEWDKDVRDAAERCKLREHDLMIPEAMDVYDFLNTWMPNQDKLDAIFIDGCGFVDQKGLKAIRRLPEWLTRRYHTPIAITMSARVSGSWKAYLDDSPAVGDTYYEKTMWEVANALTDQSWGDLDLKWDRPFVYRLGAGGTAMVLACGTIISHRAPDSGDYDINEL